MYEMNHIVICRHCGKPEYYGEMRSLSGILYCRNCYKGQLEREHHEMYKWHDLDGERPAVEEYENRKGRAVDYENNKCANRRA